MFWEEPLEGVALTPRTDGSVSTGLVAQFKTESWLRHTVICTIDTPAFTTTGAVIWSKKNTLSSAASHFVEMFRPVL